LSAYVTTFSETYWTAVFRSVKAAQWPAKRAPFVPTHITTIQEAHQSAEFISNQSTNYSAKFKADESTDWAAIVQPLI
jgi:hypothetical protein